MGEVCVKLQVHIGGGFVGRCVEGGSMCKASSSYWWWVCGAMRR